MLLERGNVAQWQWVKDTYSYRLALRLSRANFLIPSWGYGYSVAGPNDGMSFQVGVAIFLWPRPAWARLLSRRSAALRWVFGFLLAATAAGVVPDDAGGGTGLERAAPRRPDPVPLAASGRRCVHLIAVRGAWRPRFGPIWPGSESKRESVRLPVRTCDRRHKPCVHAAAVGSAHRQGREPAGRAGLRTGLPRHARDDALGRAPPHR